MDEIIAGYARCSTNEKKQDIDRQVRELKKRGTQKIYLEYEHGDSKVKPQLENFFAEAISGKTTLITLEVSRLSRSVQQLCDIIERVKEAQIRLEIVDSITVDCRQNQIDPMTKAFLQMSGVFAELELSMIRERIKSGIENARAKGKRLGRPPLTKDQIPPIFFRYYPHYVAGRLNKTALARVCKIESRTTIRKYIRLVEGQNVSP